MSRRTLTLALSTALMLVMALVAAGPANAAPSKAKQKAERARVVKYWTPKRMANATPRDFVKKNGKLVPTGKGGNKPEKPGGGGGGGSSTVTGASWAGEGPALYGTGRVFFTMDGGNYTCSGAFADDAYGDGHYSLVLTAGHCVFDERGGEYATNWMFAPAYDLNPGSCAQNPYGCFVAVSLKVHDGYASSGGFNRQAIEHDWGFATVGVSSSGDKLPEFPIHFTAQSEERTSFGYPAQGQYDGRDLVYCAGPVITDTTYGSWGLECDMTPGSSGGPWMRNFSMETKSGALNSVNSYKYTGGRKKAYMFGPKFGPKTEATYNSATKALAALEKAW